MRFLFGPAGSGKTFRCLAEIREELARCAEGPDLILLAPKQATFQLERQLLANERVRGYTRLRILSFERLAAYLFDRVGRSLPELLSEEGRVMVLRAILEQCHGNLRVFRASARLSGFARQLSALLRELQRRRLGPQALERLATRRGLPLRLADKLSDLARILGRYLEWVGDSGSGRLEDVPRLLDVAVDAVRARAPDLRIGGLWLDGFAEMTPQERALLVSVLPHSERATLAFCLPEAPSGEASWLSQWAVVSETVRECHLQVRELPETEVTVETLPRDPARSRFADSPMLAQVERVLAGATLPGGAVTSPDDSAPDSAMSLAQQMNETPMPPLRLVECSNVDTEATLAAREILQFVREGHRFRDCAIMVRRLDDYQDPLRRVLTRYGIPFFLDRREAVAHHPLAELTRFALRTVSFDWRLDDWLGVLKTGLAGLNDSDVDRLENAALARGWQGAALWLNPLAADDELKDRDWLEDRRARATRPFRKFQQRVREGESTCTGSVLAAGVRSLWNDLRVEAQLERWGRSPVRALVHTTVWDQMNDWIDNLNRAFCDVALPLHEWLQIVEAGLSGLSVGVIPPALDQVLIGSVDRSRNPDLKFVLVLGVNESVFPEPPQGLPLLTEADVADLETNGVRIGAGRRQFGHERYLGYIALTRARQQVRVTWSATDTKGRLQKPSRFVDELRQAFPGIEVESFDGIVSWEDSCHATELIAPLMSEPIPVGLEPLEALPAVQPLVQRWRQVNAALQESCLSSAVAAALYGETLFLSVSALEQFAACPFQFFVARGLRAQERDEFAVDARRTGEFQHEVLAAFHRRLRASGKRWRDFDSAQAAAWVREIGEQQLTRYQHGLFHADPLREFQARALIGNLERMIKTLTVWAGQNEFEPEAAEVNFGLDPEGWPGWSVALGNGRSVIVRGRVDRVDLLRQRDGVAAVAILDYKSGGRVFDDLKFEHGLQLQMPAYLNAICQNPRAEQQFQLATLLPAGLFYVGLRARPESGPSREAAEAAGQEALSAAFQHRGRFDEDYLRSFDRRGAQSGDQFKYRYTNHGVLHKTGNDAVPSQAFARLLEQASQQVRQMSLRILSGEATVSPYQNGREVACDHCRFLSVCRFDSWTQPYRSLRRVAALPAHSEAAK